MLPVSGGITNGSWSEDGSFVYFGSDRGGERHVWKAPAEGGQAAKQGGRAAHTPTPSTFVGPA